jgi:transcriptional regulator with XRE-family HTH domain
MPDNARAVRLRVGKNVRHLRRLRGWSQERLAEAVGNTYKHIGQVERGEVNVGIDILAAIAAGFSVNVADLFASGGSDATTAGHSITQTELDQLEQALRVVQRLKATSRRRTRPSSE